MSKYKNNPTIKFIGLRRILVDKIRELVKDYVKQTGDKGVESFEIKDCGRYRLNDK